MPEETEVVMIYRVGDSAHGLRIPAGSFDDWLRTTIATGYFCEGSDGNHIVPWHAVTSIDRNWSPL